MSRETASYQRPLLRAEQFTATNLTTTAEKDLTMPEPNTLTWYTRDILPDGRQVCAIRPDGSRQPTILLDATATTLLHAILSELACQDGVPFPAARQAVLRGFLRAHAP